MNQMLEESLQFPLGRTGAGEPPPVIILGGEANALSVARELGRLGVMVYLTAEPDCAARHSRYCRWLALGPDDDLETAWTQFLLGPESDQLRGAVVLSCSDAGIQVLARHRDALLRRFRLDESNPAAQLAMLDKLTTYQSARAAGVPTPGFWEVSAREQLMALRDQITFPLMIKPRLSHVFEEHFRRKHVIVADFDQLLSVLDVTSSANVDVLLMEHIPGGDCQLCSYYTYLDERSQSQFHFTKRIIRRYPAGMGLACYHVTDWIPEIIPLAQKLFESVGLRGVANVEFKLDPRDGQYKLIECNARFTAANCLVSASGLKLSTYVYNRITGRPLPPMEHYRKGLRLWDPIRDWSSYRELRRAGRIRFVEWAGSMLHRHTYAYFRWTDPLPAAGRATKPLRRWFRRAAQSLRGTNRQPGGVPA
jgi:predicted ATP-grasp superfamily ATP-dependent carboligase